jgi:hypothetical protein
MLLWLVFTSCGEVENRPPSLEDKVTITPEAPIYAGQTVSLQASATDPEDDGQITYVWRAINSRNENVTNEVFRGGSSGVSVNFKADIPDTYFITVTVTDSEKGEDSFSFPINVLAGNIPAVQILSPQSGTVQGIVNITVEAKDDKGVVKVEFYIDGILVAKKDSFPFSYSWDTTGITGSHVIEAKAYDSDGNFGTSGSVLVTVQDIRIEITEPADGALVDWRTTVRGTSERVPEDQHIWVFVNPRTVGRWYPQTAPSVRADGTWLALCCFGREGREDQDVEFDVGVILVDEERAIQLTREIEGGDIEPRPLFDPILALITVTRR